LLSSPWLDAPFLDHTLPFLVFLFFFQVGWLSYQRGEAAAREKGSQTHLYLSVGVQQRTILSPFGREGAVLVVTTSMRAKGYSGQWIKYLLSPRLVNRLGHLSPTSPAPNHFRHLRALS
jgi:hypothetical protein